MAITAAMVKELREMTGAGMMDCKKALEATNGDIDGAKKYLDLFCEKKKDYSELYADWQPLAEYYYTERLIIQGQ